MFIVDGFRTAVERAEFVDGISGVMVDG